MTCFFRRKLIFKLFQALFLISFGGMVYYNFEILFRGFSHFSMILCGGLSFYVIGLLNEGNRHPSFLLQMFAGSLIILFFEYITGSIVNLNFHLMVWDYSDVPFNFQGQICLPFFFLWFFLTPICILADDYIRFALFGRKKPVYRTGKTL